MSNERKERSNEPRVQPNRDRNGRLYTRATTGRTSRSFSFKEIEAEDIGRFVQRATSAGLAVILGVTSDGGAISVTILDGEERIREWPNSVAAWEELHTWLCTRYGLD